VPSARLDFLRELLSHEYEVLNKAEMKKLASACKSKDDKGNNIFHDVFMLPEGVRNKYLELIYDPGYQVKIFLKP